MRPEKYFGKEILANTIAGEAKVRDNRVFMHRSSEKLHLGKAGSLLECFCGAHISSCLAVASGEANRSDETELLCQICFGKNQTKAKELKRIVSDAGEIGFSD